MLDTPRTACRRAACFCTPMRSLAAPQNNEEFIENVLLLVGCPPLGLPADPVSPTITNIKPSRRCPSSGHGQRLAACINHMHKCAQHGHLHHSRYMLAPARQSTLFILPSPPPPLLLPNTSTPIRSTQVRTCPMRMHASHTCTSQAQQHMHAKAAWVPSLPPFPPCVQHGPRDPFCARHLGPVQHHRLPTSATAIPICCHHSHTCGGRSNSNTCFPPVYLILTCMSTFQASRHAWSPVRGIPGPGVQHDTCVVYHQTHVHNPKPPDATAAT